MGKIVENLKLILYIWCKSMVQDASSCRKLLWSRNGETNVYHISILVSKNCQSWRDNSGCRKLASLTFLTVHHSGFSCITKVTSAPSMFLKVFRNPSLLLKTFAKGHTLWCLDLCGCIEKQICMVNCLPYFASLANLVAVGEHLKSIAIHKLSTIDWSFICMHQWK